MGKIIQVDFQKSKVKAVASSFLADAAKQYYQSEQFKEQCKNWENEFGKEFCQTHKIGYYANV